MGIQRHFQNGKRTSMKSKIAKDCQDSLHCTQYPKKNGHISKRIFLGRGGGVGNGGKSDLFGNTSAAVDFNKFRWNPVNTETLLFIYYQEKLVEEVANVHVFKFPLIRK